MRPPAVAWFERLFLFSLLLAPLQAAIGWGKLSERGSQPEMLAILGLTLATLGGLALLVSRGRSGSSRWVLTLLVLIGLPLFVLSALRGTLVGSLALALIQAALQAGGIALIFTPHSREWLRRR